jgi:hypothetical protein
LHVLGGMGLRRDQRQAHPQSDEDLVFCHPQTGDPYDASQLRRRFYEAMEEAGMGHRCGREGVITFHSLRHTFGTRMAATGCGCAHCKSGWASATWRPAEIYADYAPDPAYGAAFAEDALLPRQEKADELHCAYPASGNDPRTGEAPRALG